MVEKTPVSQSVIDQISKQLEPGEVIRWLDSPGMLPLNPAKIKKMCFIGCIAEAPFIIFFVLLVIKYRLANPVPLFLLLVMLPSIICSIPLLRLMLPAIHASIGQNQVYVITSKRVIVWNCPSSTLKKDYRPEDIQTLSVKDSVNGTGDILFNVENDHGPMSKYRKPDAVLNRVDNVRHVESLLLELLGKKKLF